MLWAHWPQMVVLFLLGWTGRMGFLWLTTAVSDWSPTVAVLILPLAPLSTLVSLVLMLRVCAESLPAFQGTMTTAGVRNRVKDDLVAAGQVLLPFLAVYASAGLLVQDAKVFLLDSVVDENFNEAVSQTDWGRANYAEGWALIAMVVAALTLRKLVSMLDLPKRHVAWAGFAAYLETLWIMTLATAFTTKFEELQAWVTSRQAISGLVGFWNSSIEWLRAIGGPVTFVVDSVSTFLGNLGAVALVPVAWLAIGAAVYGQKLTDDTLAVPTHEEVVRRIDKVPQPVRRAVAHVAEPVTTPIKSAWKAISKLAVAGIIPMVMFCLVFVVAGSLQVGAALFMRWVIGPGETMRQYAMEPYAVLAERGVYFVAALALLAAAVNAVVQGQREREAEAAATAAEAGGEVAEPNDLVEVAAAAVLGDTDEYQPKRAQQ